MRSSPARRTGHFLSYRRKAANLDARHPHGRQSMNLAPRAFSGKMTMVGSGAVGALLMSALGLIAALQFQSQRFPRFSPWQMAKFLASIADAPAGGRVLDLGRYHRHVHCFRYRRGEGVLFPCPGVDCRRPRAHRLGVVRPPLERGLAQHRRSRGGARDLRSSASRCGAGRFLPVLDTVPSWVCRRSGREPYTPAI